MQNLFAGNYEKARESFKQMETVEVFEAFQNRLSDGKEVDVIVRDDIFWFYAFNKLVLAQSNSIRFAVRYCNHLYSGVLFCWKKFVEYEDLIFFCQRYCSNLTYVHKSGENCCSTCTLR